MMDVPLIEEVEKIFDILYSRDETFRSLLTAIYPEDAVEGSLISDDHAAAYTIRNYAIRHDLKTAANTKLALIVEDMRQIMHRRNT